MTKFSDQKLTNLEQRAKRVVSRSGPAHHGFLHLEAAKVLADRLAVTNRTFSAPAILFSGPFSPLIEKTLSENCPSITSAFLHMARPDKLNPYLAIEPESLDLAVSVFDLHRINDLPAMMLQINHALKPDGLFLGVLPSAGTLNELQTSIMEAELEIRDGAAARVDPFAEIRQYGDLLHKTGFKLPVCDLEERTVRYQTIGAIAHDLRGAGTSAAGIERLPVLTRSILDRASEIYREKFSDEDGKIRVSVNLAFLSGWKAHSSQQKPLRPGTATHSLKDFL